MRCSRVLEGKRWKNASVACCMRAAVGWGSVALRVIMRIALIAGAANSSDWP
jgi:hypothetical protein